jgi:beta-xylosidase
VAERQFVHEGIGEPLPGTPEYSQGYATADRPTGPFKKFEGNPIVSQNERVWGPGHGCVVKDGEGNLWSVYHQKISPERSYLRDICIDPMWFDEKGVLHHGKATRGEARPAPKCP